ncbi:MAG: hypothetical protein KGD68_07810 [Candidatus Lokiarchaeota archaeon]|nr:hypothetical protein [Candidatus Lokiarchaeota archaeon]
MFKAGKFSIPTEFKWIGDWAEKRAILTPNREALFYLITLKKTFILLMILT